MSSSSRRPRYIDHHSSTLDSLDDDLRRNGFAILPKVLCEKDVDAAVRGCRDGVLAMTQGNVDVSVKDTWKNWFDYRPQHGMLMQHYGIGHQEWVWMVRQNPSIVSVFAKLYGCRPEDLLVSFDGASISMPTGNCGWFKGRYWMHTDQAPSKKGRQCVQGFINLKDVSEGDATFCCIPGSHLDHADFFANHCNPPVPADKLKDDWYMLNDEGLEHLASKRGIVAIMPKAGDLVLWDSRLFHQGIQPMRDRKSDSIRMVVYVCYTPRKLATAADIRKRLAYFRDARMTTHWPHKPKVFSVMPRSYGNLFPPHSLAKPLDVAKLTALGARLVGFASLSDARPFAPRPPHRAGGAAEPVLGSDSGSELSDSDSEDDLPLSRLLPPRPSSSSAASHDVVCVDDDDLPLGGASSSAASRDVVCVDDDDLPLGGDSSSAASHDDDLPLGGASSSAASHDVVYISSDDENDPPIAKRQKV